MIAPTSFFSDYGGHIRILEETRILQELGHQVRIVTYYKGSDLPGIDIRRTAPLPWRTDYEVGSSRHKIAFDVYLSIQSLIEGIKMRPDVIHGHMGEGALIGGVLSRILRVPLVFDFQGLMTAEMVDHNFLDPNGIVYSWMYRLERFISKRLPKAILTSSVKARQILHQEFDIPLTQIHPLPDCADINRFDPQIIDPSAQQRIRQRFRLPDDHLIVAYLGLLTDYQGTPHIIEAARYFQEIGAKVHFLVMGYPSVGHYQQLARRKGVGHRVTFTGKVEYRDAPLYLSLGDIAVAPKMSTTEGSGKLLNYMALCQPVVAYETAVHREYLGDLGVYAPVGNIEAFTQGIARLVENPQLRQELGTKLRQRARNKYSWRAAGEQIVQIYRDILR